jgi:hypothetical protein
VQRADAVRGRDDHVTSIPLVAVARGIEKKHANVAVANHLELRVVFVALGLEQRRAVLLL